MPVKVRTLSMSANYMVLLFNTVHRPLLNKLLDASYLWHTMLELHNFCLTLQHIFGTHQNSVKGSVATALAVLKLYTCLKSQLFDDCTPYV